MEFKVINSFKKSIVFKNIFNDHIVVSIFLKLYSELDSFGSSTVPGHLRINIFVFPECQSILIY